MSKTRNKNCAKCMYRTRITNAEMGCGYIMATGHMRGCAVEKCKHWKDKEVEKKNQYNKFTDQMREKYEQKKKKEEEEKLEDMQQWYDAEIREKTGQL